MIIYDNLGCIIKWIEGCFEVGMNKVEFWDL